MHIEEEPCTKLFYYVYLCKWQVRLFKKVSLAPPLFAPWSVFIACILHNVRWEPWLVLYKEKSTEASLFFSNIPQSLKWSNVKYVTSSYNSFSLLMKSGCRLIRWTVYSYLLSSSIASIPLHLIISSVHINNSILPSYAPHLANVLVKHFAFLLLLHNFISSSFNFNFLLLLFIPQLLAASALSPFPGPSSLFLSSHLFRILTLLSAAPSSSSTAQEIKIWGNNQALAH